MSEEPYTPTTAAIRESHAFTVQSKIAGGTFGQGLAEFDRWFAAEIAKAQAEALAIIDQLIDLDPCEWDHNHSCQAHGAFYIPQGEKCPNQAGRDLLAAAAIREGEKTE